MGDHFSPDYRGSAQGYCGSGTRQIRWVIRAVCTDRSPLSGTGCRKKMLLSFVWVKKEPASEVAVVKVEFETPSWTAHPPGTLQSVFKAASMYWPTNRGSNTGSVFSAHVEMCHSTSFFVRQLPARSRLSLLPMYDTPERRLQGSTKPCQPHHDHEGRLE